MKYIKKYLTPNPPEFIEKVTKKEIKKLLKKDEKKTSNKEKISIFFVSLFRKFQLKNYRDHNKKLVNYDIYKNQKEKLKRG